MKSQKFESSDITAPYDLYDVLGCIFKYKGLNVKYKGTWGSLTSLSILNIFGVSRLEYLS